jgi:hypothetical protein
LVLLIVKTNQSQNSKNMERRNFLSATSLVVATGFTFGLSAASSTFDDMSSYVSLNELSKPSKKVLDNFVNELEQNFGSHSDKDILVKRIAMPIRIINQSSKSGTEYVIYKNKAGQYVKLTLKDDVETIYISNDPIYA